MVLQATVVNIKKKPPIITSPLQYFVSERTMF